MHFTELKMVIKLNLKRVPQAAVPEHEPSPAELFDFTGKHMQEMEKENRIQEADTGTQGQGSTAEDQGRASGKSKGSEDKRADIQVSFCERGDMSKDYVTCLLDTTVSSIHVQSNVKRAKIPAGVANMSQEKKTSSMETDFLTKVASSPLLLTQRVGRPIVR
jgi:hypothetical protein